MEEKTFEGWEHLKFWNSGEWQVIEERLDEYDINDIVYNPNRDLIFDALRVCPFGNTKVAIIGQDPYPQSKFATGIAFSIPEQLRKYPPTLEMIYGELWDDLKVKRRNGSLLPWCSQGVLLWNTVPTCLSGKSMSHDWTEWTYLTTELIQQLTKKGIVFAMLGSVARRYASLARETSGVSNVVIETGHPSPRGNLSARNPFTGSRLFSTINAGLVSLGQTPINWS